MQIPNASLRRSIVNLVEQIAGPEVGSEAATDSVGLKSRRADSF